MGTCKHGNKDMDVMRLSNLNLVEMVEKEPKFFIYSSLVVIESLALIYFSLQTYQVFPEFRLPFTRPGDLLHFIAYFFYGFFLSKAFGFLNGNKKLVFISAFIFGSLFGGLNETIQYFVLGRFSDPIDFLINASGVGFSLLLILVQQKLHRRPINNE